MAPIFTGSKFGFGRVSGPIITVFTVTGGSTFDSGGYRYHVFTSSGPLNVQGAPGTISNLLIVGAGGYGGISRCGGGGAGGVRNLSSIPATVQDYTITVGSGGINRGGSSSALGYSASGGGAMVGDNNLPGGGPLGPGGSGCGGPGNVPGIPLVGTGNVGGYSPPEGNPGGNGSNAIGGGGGGAGATGAAAPFDYPNPGVQGGNGVLIPWVPTAYGENGYFAAGGSSVGYPDITAPPGNTFGGGGGGNRAALANTGGGGGGYGPNAAGGSGVVILRYVYP